MKIDRMRGSGELFEFSYLNNIGRGCSTSISFLTIPNTTNLSPTNFIQNMSRMVSRSLIDTGADLSFISSTKARGLLRRGIGKLDKGRYKVVDAFLKAHFFSESLTVDFVFDELIKSMLSETCFTIKLVIVDIPLNSEVIIDLADIRRLRIFDLLPHLVRQEATGQEEEEEIEDLVINNRVRSDRIFTESRLCQIYGSEWIDEDQHIEADVGSDGEEGEDGETLLASLVATVNDVANEVDEMSWGRRAYERDDISEMDLDRFEAIPSEALRDLPPTLPTKFFGPEELKEKLKVLVEKYHMIFSKSVNRIPAKVTPMRIEVDPKLWKLPKNRLPPRNLGKVREEEVNRQVDILLEKGCVQTSRASEHSHPFTVPKSAGEWRLVMDLVNLNQATTDAEQWPIPRIGEL